MVVGGGREADQFVILGEDSALVCEHLHERCLAHGRVTWNDDQDPAHLSSARIRGRVHASSYILPRGGLGTPVAVGPRRQDAPITATLHRSVTRGARFGPTVIVRLPCGVVKQTSVTLAFPYQNPRIKRFEDRRSVEDPR